MGGSRNRPVPRNPALGIKKSGRGVEYTALPNGRGKCVACLRDLAWVLFLCRPCYNKKRRDAAKEREIGEAFQYGLGQEHEGISPAAEKGEAASVD